MYKLNSQYIKISQYINSSDVAGFFLQGRVRTSSVHLIHMLKSPVHFYTTVIGIIKRPIYRFLHLY